MFNNTALNPCFSSSTFWLTVVLLSNSLMSSISLGVSIYEDRCCPRAEQPFVHQTFRFSMLNVDDAVKVLVLSVLSARARPSAVRLPHCLNRQLCIFSISSCCCICVYSAVSFKRLPSPRCSSLTKRLSLLNEKITDKEKPWLADERSCSFVLFLW